MTRDKRSNVLAISAAAVAVGMGLLMQKALTSLPPGPNDDVLAIASQSDGRVLIAGRFTPNRISRLDESGNPDLTFAAKLAADGFNRDVFALAVQKDDAIVVGGEFTAFDDAIVGHVARLDADGNLDREFARTIGTGFDGPVTSLALQPDGKILIGGRFLSFNGATVRYLARLHPEGSLDKEFTGSATLDGPVLSLVSDAETGLLAGGDFRPASGSETGFISGFSVDGAIIPMGRGK